MKRRYVFLLVVMTMAAFGFVGRSTPAEAHPGNDGCPDDPPWDRPDGLLIMQEGTTGQYLIEACGKRPFLNADDLASHYFDSTAATISPQETSSIVTGSTIRAREGTLYRKIGDSAVWIINVVEGSPPAPPTYYKRFVSGARWTQLFVNNCGYTDAMIRNVPASVVDSYATGTDVEAGVRPDGQIFISGTAQYLIEAGRGRFFPEPSALASYNFPFPACSGYPPPLNGATIKAREGTWFKASGGSVKYLVDQVGTAYHKRSLSTNSAANYSLSGTPRNWPSSHVNTYAEIAAAHMIKTQWLPTRSWLNADNLGAGTEYVSPVPPGSWDTEPDPVSRTVRYLSDHAASLAAVYRSS